MNKEQKPITEDVKRLCDICHDLGYIGSLADEHYHDSRGSDKADRVVEYITELFNAKRWGENHDYRCSKCGYDHIGKTNFCPNCGARMYKDGEDE